MVRDLTILVLVIFESLIALIFLILAAAFKLKKGDSAQEQAKKRIRIEIDGQRLNIKKSLTNQIMDRDGIYQQQETIFRQSIEKKQDQLTDQQNDLQAGIEVIKQLQQAFNL